MTVNVLINIHKGEWNASMCFFIEKQGTYERQLSTHKFYSNPILLFPW